MVNKLKKLMFSDRFMNIITYMIFKIKPVPRLLVRMMQKYVKKINDIKKSRRYIDGNGMSFVGARVSVDVDLIRYNNNSFDIVIPVFNGYEHVIKLFSSLMEYTDRKHGIIIVDDASTDENVKDFLNGLLEKNSNIKLLRNNINLGFVGSVNRALSITDKDVIILNSDVIVTYKWIEKLTRPLLGHEKIASITPLSNSSTLTSFPIMFKDNDEEYNKNIEYMNKCCDELVELGVSEFESPTGVGFCMVMTREALNEVGYFDDASFGKGYGEENDWCMRAFYKGYKNIINLGLYLIHEHGGSFCTREKKKLMKKNEKTLLSRYKEYPELVRKIKKDYEYTIVRRYLNYLTIVRSNRDVVVIFHHMLGGGSDFYINQKMPELFTGNIAIMVRSAGGEYYVDVTDGEAVEYFKFHSLYQLDWLLNDLTIKQVIVNEIYGYRDPASVLDYILLLKNRSSGTISFIGHDLYPVCPSLTLLDYNGDWCDGGDPGRCRLCYFRVKKPKDISASSVFDWREMWSKFFNQCSEVIVFSNFTKEMYLKCLNSVEIKFGNMPVEQLRRVKYNFKLGIRIAVIGHLGYHKGARIVKELYEYSKRASSGYKIFVIGNLDKQYKIPNKNIYGSYMIKELPEIIEKYNINYVLIPSICGETYSLTTDEVMKMGLPLAVFNLGAPVERVSTYKNGLIIENTSAANIVNSIKKHVDYIESQLGDDVMVAK